MLFRETVVFLFPSLLMCTFGVSAHWWRLSVRWWGELLWGPVFHAGLGFGIISCLEGFMFVSGQFVIALLNIGVLGSG